VSRLLLVEGVPGSGKTSAVEAAAQWLSAQGTQVTAFREGDPHPVDLAWQWWLTDAEFEAVCRDHPGAAAELRRCAWVGPSGVAVAYTKVDPAACGGQWPDVEAALQDREPFQGRLSSEGFVDALAARWRDFGYAVGAREGSRDPHVTVASPGAPGPPPTHPGALGESGSLARIREPQKPSLPLPDGPDTPRFAGSPHPPPGVVIFDGALLQDTLVELVLFGQRDAEQITDDLLRLTLPVAGWDPVVLRLVPIDLGAALAAAARERVDERGRPVWWEAAEAYAAETPWARTRGLSQGGALQAYLEHRQHLEEQVLPHLPVQWVDVPSPAGTGAGWEGVRQRLESTVAGLTDRRAVR
jgi:hypothetical protein